MRKPSTEAFPDKVGGGGEAPLQTHSTLLAAGALLFLPSTLAFHSLFALTYLPFGDSEGFKLCCTVIVPIVSLVEVDLDFASLLPPLTLRPAADQLFS